MKKILRRALVVLVVLLALIQLYPYGRGHTNPPVVQEPRWDAPRTRELAARACFDCHSNETRWPWYAHVAPASWLIQNDVEEGRHHLNLSEWQRPQRHANEAGEQIEEDEMPLWYYEILHPSARLSESEQRELIDGLAATFEGQPAANVGTSVGTDGKEKDR